MGNYTRLAGVTTNHKDDGIGTERPVYKATDRQDRYLFFIDSSSWMFGSNYTKNLGFAISNKGKELEAHLVPAGNWKDWLDGDGDNFQPNKAITVECTTAGSFLYGHLG